MLIYVVSNACENSASNEFRDVLELEAQGVKVGVVAVFLVEGYPLVDSGE